MGNDLPEPESVWKAIDIYLSYAYEANAAPAAVKTRLNTLREAGASLYASSALELDNKESPNRYSLRLGNRQYPHMKLTIDRRPGGNGYLFRADTHDRHICPAEGSKDHAAFVELMNKNQSLAQTIEAAWGEQGLPTFKTFLRDDLARRSNSSGGDAAA